MGDIQTSPTKQDIHACAGIIYSYYCTYGNRQFKVLDISQDERRIRQYAGDDFQRYQDS